MRITDIVLTQSMGTIMDLRSHLETHRSTSSRSIHRSVQIARPRRPTWSDRSMASSRDPDRRRHIRHLWPARG